MFGRRRSKINVAEPVYGTYDMRPLHGINQMQSPSRNMKSAKMSERFMPSQYYPTRSNKFGQPRATPTNLLFKKPKSKFQEVSIGRLATLHGGTKRPPRMPQDPPIGSLATLNVNQQLIELKEQATALDAQVRMLRAFDNENKQNKRRKQANNIKRRNLSHLATRAGLEHNFVMEHNWPAFEGRH
jgi:hypothetical protein